MKSVTVIDLRVPAHGEELFLFFLERFSREFVLSLESILNSYGNGKNQKKEILVSSTIIEEKVNLLLRQEQAKWSFEVAALSKGASFLPWSDERSLFYVLFRENPLCHVFKNLKMIQVLKDNENLGVFCFNPETPLNEFFELELETSLKSHFLIRNTFLGQKSWGLALKREKMGELFTNPLNILEVYSQNFLNYLKENDQSLALKQFVTDSCQKCLPCYLVRQMDKLNHSLLKEMSYLQCRIPQLVYEFDLSLERKGVFSQKEIL